MFRTADGKNHLKTILLVCCLFCLSGLCNGMIDVLNKHFQNSLRVSKAQSALVQGFWYGGYFLLALPAGIFARRYGYRGGILFGLSVIAAGCVCFVPVTKIVASQSVIFSVLLLALGLVACGFTFIETIANPYATVLGSPEAGVARINLAQSCNAVGWIFGPLLGGSFILSKTKLASSWMVTAVVGGSLMPMLMGWLADTFSMRVGFMMPFGCFIFIAFYGFGWPKLYRHGLDLDQKIAPAPAH